MSSASSQKRVVARATIALIFAVLVPLVGHSQDLAYLPPPPAWNDWLSATDWVAMTVRAQDEPSTLSFESRQAPSAESRRGYYPSLIEQESPRAAAEPTSAVSPQSRAQEVAETPLDSAANVGVVDTAAFATSQSPEIASVIQQSTRVQSTEFQKRSQISLEPNIRGFQGPSVYMQSDGLYWSPIRPDLDSMLNRLDPSLYENISVISGPYGLRYGPGFAFMRITNIDTPRNPNGYESHFRTGISTRTNGGQIYGRQTVFGGGCDWGYIFNYGNRVGGDYDPGGNSPLPPVPGSYKSQSLLGQVGFDLSPQSSLEFRFRRLDDTDTEYPLQFFDVDYMGVDAYSMHYNSEDPCGSGTFSAMGWYSRSRFNGDTLPRQPNSPYYSVNRVNAALNERLAVNDSNLFGSTNGYNMISGARVNKTYGDPDWTLLSLGADFRYMSQRINEDFAIRSRVTPLPPFSTNLPNSDYTNPGAYTELTLSWLPYLTTTLGGRVDWVRTSTDTSEFRRNSNLTPYLGELTQNDVLYAFYLSNELELNCHWTARLAGGYSQRAPSVLERYADGVFVSVAQSGLTRVIGTPTLQKEELWQVDASLEGQFDRWGGKIGGFYGWVDDPITYIGSPVLDPTGAYLLRYTNGNLFVRTGFEALGEWKMNDQVSLFGTARYVWGEDKNILVQNVGYRDVPLLSIFPFSSDVGIRIHDADGGNRWGVEMAMLMVDSQDRSGFVRLGTTFVQNLDPNFETRTGGYTTCRIGGYFNVTENLYVVGGVDNLFDRTYLQHLNQRLVADTINGRNFQEVAVLSPGITPYFGFEWNY